MENKIFSFGKVKGMNMVEVMNMENIHANFSGLQYLWGQYNRSTNDTVKKEIAECFKTYAGDYIIRFGKYKGLTLKQIDEINRSYLENYLTHNDNEEIRMVVKTYLKYHPKKISQEYNIYQQKAYAYYDELKKRINDSRQSSIEQVIRVLGYTIENGKFEHCPWGCDMHSRKYRHAFLRKGTDDSYFVGCFKCGEKRNFIKFVCEKKGYSFTEALKWISDILGIMVSNVRHKNIEEIKREFINTEEEILLEKRILPEISLEGEGFGFNKGVYPPAFFKRGFTVEDAEEMEVYFAGRDCTNGFRNRICFLVRDLDGRLVGIVGRNKYSEEEYYDYWAKRLGLKNMSKEEQIKKIENQNCKYIKYYNSPGFRAGCVLYNASRLVNNHKEQIFIVEGVFDVMKMVKYGYKNTVGMFGHSLSRGQLYQLYKLYKDVMDKIKVFLLVDNDEAGLKGFENNVKSLQELGFKNIYKMVIEGAKDAGEATKEQVDKAYKTAQLQTIRYNKKKIVVKDYDTGLKSAVE